ncbi:DUF742 domain-containing protein [Streptomyces aidingensis]|uniref:DUF742 domain-containing protein n=1 Tax=Streptomyces aidingensis TaxID=910347 RepID=A0A1I1IWV0_9ACTN|nr:DUF742 domain-containing protein [Streptomyces aidingensis]SFC40714.1 Protein of unknown function [Streptomyces aidingensis]
MSDAPDWHEDSPERFFMITGGRAGHVEHAALGLVTLILSKAAPKPGMSLEQASVLRLCRSPLSVAEITAHLKLPFSVVTVLLMDLLSEGNVEARSPAPIPKSAMPDRDILRRVIGALQSL